MWGLHLLWHRKKLKINVLLSAKREVLLKGDKENLMKGFFFGFYGLGPSVVCCSSVAHQQHLSDPLLSVWLG